MRTAQLPAVQPGWLQTLSAEGQDWVGTEDSVGAGPGLRRWWSWPTPGRPSPLLLMPGFGVSPDEPGHFRLLPVPSWSRSVVPGDPGLALS